MGRPLQYRVELTPDQAHYLETLTRKGKHGARLIRRARTLLMSHQGVSNHDIQTSLSISVLTIRNTRRNFTQHGLEAALHDAPRPGRPPKFDGKDRAAITGIACTQAPEGHARWSIRLIADKAVELQVVDGIAPSTVYYILKKMSSSRTGSVNGASPD